MENVVAALREQDPFEYLHNIYTQSNPTPQITLTEFKTAMTEYNEEVVIAVLGEDVVSLVGTHIGKHFTYFKEGLLKGIPFQEIIENYRLTTYIPYCSVGTGELRVYDFYLYDEMKSTFLLKLDTAHLETCRQRCYDGIAISRAAVITANLHLGYRTVGELIRDLPYGGFHAFILLEASRTDSKRKLDTDEVSVTSFQIVLEKDFRGVSLSVSKEMRLNFMVINRHGERHYEQGEAASALAKPGLELNDVLEFLIGKKTQDEGINELNQDYCWPIFRLSCKGFAQRLFEFLTGEFWDGSEGPRSPPEPPRDP